MCACIQQDHLNSSVSWEHTKMYRYKSHRHQGQLRKISDVKFGQRSQYYTHVHFSVSQMQELNIVRPWYLMKFLYTLTRNVAEGIKRFRGRMMKVQVLVSALLLLMSMTQANGEQYLNTV